MSFWRRSDTANLFEGIDFAEAMTLFSMIVRECDWVLNVRLIWAEAVAPTYWSWEMLIHENKCFQTSNNVSCSGPVCVAHCSV